MIPTFDIDNSPPEDLNGDGLINGLDCPYTPGSVEAKIWWNKVMIPYTKSQITPELQAKYGDNIKGVFEGKPLIPGPGVGHGDYSYLVNKLMVTEGLDRVNAENVAGAIKAKLMKRG